MTLRQFEVFLAVAGERSFSRAAKKLHSSQPTLSEHVSELERELGKKLFFRRGREVTLTEAGRVFEEYAARAISAVDGARQAIAELDGLGHGSVLVGASTTPGLYVMPRIIAAFRARYRSEEHTSELQSPCNLVCRLLLEKKKKRKNHVLVSMTQYVHERTRLRQA